MECQAAMELCHTVSQLNKVMMEAIKVLALYIAGCLLFLLLNEKVQVLGNGMGDVNGILCFFI